MILTRKEILDLAEFAGFEITDQSKMPEDFEIELTIENCPENGILDEDTNEREGYRYIAYFSEYIEEGCLGLGDKLF